MLFVVTTVHRFYIQCHVKVAHSLNLNPLTLLTAANIILLLMFCTVITDDELIAMLEEQTETQGL